MDFTNYKIADITDKSRIREHLQKVEADLSKEFNEDIVLITFKRNDDSIKKM